ncbi:MAG: hypothetical protein V4734_02605, partial [Terriglobus sp.]
MSNKVSSSRSLLQSSEPLYLTPYVALLALYAFCWPTIHHYLPFGDDPAVFQGSEGSPVTWFTQGFSRYFYVFPEWNVPFTDFLRPGVNLILRIEQSLFHAHYAAYFALLFLAQAGLVTLVLLLSLRFGASRVASIIAALLVAVNPAFVDFDLWSVVNHFDVWCGVFAVLALWSIFSQRYVLAFLALTAAIFTKEAALYAPLAASLSVYVLYRKRSLAALMLAPLALWFLVRKLVFTLN